MTEEELLGATAAQHTPPFMDETKGQSDGDMKNKVSNALLVTKEQIDLEEMQMKYIDQAQDTHRPMTVLTYNLLWDCTAFPDYVLTTEQSDTCVDPMADQGTIRHKSEKD